MGIVKDVNSKLEESVVATKRQCWENAHYSKKDMLDVVISFFEARYY